LQQLTTDGSAVLVAFFCQCHVADYTGLFVSP